MKNGLTNKVILSTSLLLALTAFSSCGKSKEVKSNPPTVETAPAPAPTVTPNNTVTAPNQPANPDNTLTAPNQQPAGPGDNRLPDTGAPQNPNGQILPALPQSPDDQINNPQQGGRPNPRTGRGGNTGNVNGQPAQPKSPDQQIREREKQQALNKKSAAEINFKGVEAIKTGGQVKTVGEAPEMFYTGTGADGLTEEFKSYNGRVSPEQQNMNTNLAKAIVGAKFSRPNLNTVGSVVLSIDEFGTVKTYRMITSSDGDKLKLTKTTSGTTGEMDVQGGFIKCLDIAGKCDTAYAKIKIAGGYTRIIFRNSEADLHFLLQENIVGNSNFDILSKYVLNAANALNTTERVERMRLSSYEVINGRAAVGAVLTTENREMIQLSVPMVVSGFDSEVSAKVTKSTDISKSFDLPTMTGTHSQNLSRLVNEARLVNNNGRGEFKLQLQLGTEMNPASIWIVVGSSAKETLSLQQVRDFESKVKPF